jgi:hypothetical protein
MFDWPPQIVTSPKSTSSSVPPLEPSLHVAAKVCGDCEPSVDGRVTRHTPAASAVAGGRGVPSIDSFTVSPLAAKPYTIVNAESRCSTMWSPNTFEIEHRPALATAAMAAKEARRRIIFSRACDAAARMGRARDAAARMGRRWAGVARGGA